MLVFDVRLSLKFKPKMFWQFKGFNITFEAECHASKQLDIKKNV